MKICMFYHSLYSDWNHGNAHFLRGIGKELLRRGHELVICEPIDNWSTRNLRQDHGEEPIDDFKTYYPELSSHFYDPDSPEEINQLVAGSDVVIVHEWNSLALVKLLGEIKSRWGYKLLFHDTHHRIISDFRSILKFDFSNFDGALVFGEVLKGIYQKNKLLPKVWTWHEAADATLFRPIPEAEKKGDLVWIGNWGDDEREEELMEFLIRPVKELGIKAKVYGVRYPKKALDALSDAGIEYKGYLPNFKVPEVFSQYRLTVHVPRKPYVKMLPGIPTIRPFEAMACGIPLVSSLWQDKERLFERGQDHLHVSNGIGMRKAIADILQDQQLASKLSSNGRKTILERHTCSHRVDQLEQILLGEEGVYQESTIQTLND